MGILSEGFGRNAFKKPEAAIFSEAPHDVSPTCIEANIDYNNKAFRILKRADGKGYDLEAVIVTYRGTWLPDTGLAKHLAAREVLERVAPHAHPQTLRDVNEFLGFDRNYVLPPKFEVIEGGYEYQSLRVA